MDNRINRFKYCDPRFYPYLETVLERLPEEIRENVLNNQSLQILAHEDFHAMCVSRYDFDSPVQKLIYLNTRVLKEPEHRVLFTIAHEIAKFVLAGKGVESGDKEVEALVMNWGFEEEMKRVRYCHAITETVGYKLGYEWAKKQNHDYLLQHFGLYFDEWNRKGLGRMSREKFKELHDEADIPSLLSKMPDLQMKEVDRVENDQIAETFTKDETITAGIMAAVKEIKYEEEYGAKTCTVPGV